jgi:hypothetical protein
LQQHKRKTWCSIYTSVWYSDYVHFMSLQISSLKHIHTHARTHTHTHTPVTISWRNFLKSNSLIISGLKSYCHTTRHTHTHTHTYILYTITFKSFFLVFYTSCLHKKEQALHFFLYIVLCSSQRYMAIHQNKLNVQ